jgi:hypothetical protein
MIRRKALNINFKSNIGPFIFEPFFSTLNSMNISINKIDG